MTEKEMREMEKVMFNVQMKVLGKDVAYITDEEIVSIVADNKIGTLSQECYDFYRDKITKQLAVNSEAEEKKEQDKINEHTLTVESDIQKALAHMVKEQNKMPMMARKNENEIRNDIKNIASRWSGGGSKEYQEKLREYCGTGLTFAEPSGGDVFMKKAAALLGGEIKFPEGE